MFAAAERLSRIVPSAALWPANPSISGQQTPSTYGHYALAVTARDLDYLIAFNRGKRISALLSDLWVNKGGYLGAREALQAAILEDNILDGTEDLTGIHVMTIHRSKGKQFDGVIIFEYPNRVANEWMSSLVWRDDPFPYHRSRRILRVGLTRAISHVLILHPPYPKCPILEPNDMFSRQVK